ncbi:hypothetical protein CEUSTIGMA_g11379.t1 [Chlamydomonas eustigma]|uniref:Uncharacterized protein n=1 Tax=Chlamydomonas eustigma TaxID=1157962 RepID=A0A250XLH2_9CHLO|nr:hypothetical protein CEUSTIGMA_g11379.t1 [Chlamydomonas eustigma]|eukprot:GAX83955.1 hypothetical protein CEUSTIGMA_g11379.t1 [Chlamydomonas eustigma]
MAKLESKYRLCKYPAFGDSSLLSPFSEERMISMYRVLLTGRPRYEAKGSLPSKKLNSATLSRFQMGNVATKTARRKLGDAIQEKVFQRSLPEPMTSEQIAVMNKLTEREQERMKDLPSLEEINSKDASLGQLLDKLSASISGRRIDVSRGQDQRDMLASPSTSTSDSVDTPSHGSMPGDMRPLPSHRGATAAAAQHPTASPASGTGQRTAWGS